MNRGRYGVLLQFPGADDVHWPASHPLSCGVRGSAVGADGPAVTCPRCLANVRDNLTRCAAALRSRLPEPSPKRRPPPRSSYRVERVSGWQQPDSAGFQRASGACTRAGQPSKRTWWVYRSDGSGSVDIVVRPSGEWWSTADRDLAQALVDHLNSAYKGS